MVGVNEIGDEMKKGFSLMELLVVMAIVSVISVSSGIMFGNINDDSAETDRMNIYKDMQRAALLHLDLNNAALSQFRNAEFNGTFTIGLETLMNHNYVDIELIDPVTNERFPNYFVVIYTEKDYDGKDFINTCVLDNVNYLKKGCDQWEKYYDSFGQCVNMPGVCIANSRGEAKDCCTLKG